MALDLQSKKLLWKYTPTDRQFTFYRRAPSRKPPPRTIRRDLNRRRGSCRGSAFA
jgi:hypothetical protein